MVRSVSRKEAARTNCAPNRARVEMRARKWARESIRCLLCAYAADVSESPIEHADLSEGRTADGDELDGEELAGWDL